MKTLLIEKLLALALAGSLSATPLFQMVLAIPGGTAAPAAGAGSISVIQSVSDDACSFAGDSRQCAFGSSTGSGHTIAGCVALTVSGTGGSVTLSDTQGLTYSKDAATQIAINDGSVELSVTCFHSTTTTSAAADTVSSLPSTGFTSRLWIWELSSTSGGVTFQTGSTATGSGSSVASGTITPSKANGFVIAISMAFTNGGAANYDVGTNFTLASQDGGGSGSWATESWAQTMATATVGDFTVCASACGLGNWIVGQAVFVAT